MRRNTRIVMIVGTLLIGSLAGAPLFIDIAPGALRFAFGFVITLLAVLVLSAEWSFHRTVGLLQDITDERLPAGGGLWETTERFDELQHDLEQHPELRGVSDAISEIREATFRFDDRLRNVFQAREFIDPAWFRAVAGPALAPSAVVSAAPGLLTALGILGTFIGLVSGLPSDPTFGDDELGILLAGLKTSFSTSVMGLAWSMVVTLVSRTVEGRAGNVVDTFVNRLDARLQRGTSQELLWQVLDEQRQSTSELKTLNTDLAQALEEAIVAVSEQHVVPAFERLEAHSEAMRAVATDLADGATQNQVEGVGRIVDQVVDEMAGSLGAHLKDAAESLSGYATEQRTLLTQWRSTVAELEATSRRYESAAEAQEEFSKQMREVMAPALQLGVRNQVAVDALSKTMERLETVGEQAQKLTADLASAATAYREGAHASARRLTETTAAMSELRQQWRAIVNEVDAVTKDLNQGMQSFVDGFPQSIEGVMVKFDQAMAVGVQRLAASTARLEETLDELGDRLERAVPVEA